MAACPELENGVSLRQMRESLEKKVLKGVSRSFYLTLRMLPPPMRRGASLGYLLARTSDTLADSAAVPVESRLQALELFSRALSGNGDVPRWPLSLLNSVSNTRERHLLECAEDLFTWLAVLPPGEAGLVRNVVQTITSGQRLDLERFGNPEPAGVKALDDDAMLDDYAWRVAGCVGEFWTKLGFLTMGRRFSHLPEDELNRLGINYGKGLQLVNILRDVPEDLAGGRCYLPVANPAERGALVACHRKWREKAGEWIGDGKRYAAALSSRRVRAASLLPALLAEKTLAKMVDTGPDSLQPRIRIPRKEVYRSLVRALFS